MAHATIADLILRYDIREIGDMATDTDERLDEAAILASDIVQTVMDDAKSEVLSAVQRGGKYTVAQIEALTGDAENLLIRIECDVAMFYLYRRRGNNANPDKAAEQAKQARRLLDMLVKGDAAFGTAEELAASTVEYIGLTDRDYESIQLIRDRVQNYYPRRVSRP